MAYLQLTLDGLPKREIFNENILWDATRLCTAAELTPEEMVRFKVVPLLEGPVPIYDNTTHSCDKVGVEHTDLGWRIKWVVSPLPESTVVLNSRANLEQQRSEAKQRRQERVDAIQVTTNAGNTFNGDEASKVRMSSVIASLRFLQEKLNAGTPVDLSALDPTGNSIRLDSGAYTANWVLANNKTAYVRVEELEEALALSGVAQATIWML